jgi:hypothetical protein
MRRMRAHAAHAQCMRRMRALHAAHAQRACAACAHCMRRMQCMRRMRVHAPHATAHAPHAHCMRRKILELRDEFHPSKTRTVRIYERACGACIKKTLLSSCAIIRNAAHRLHFDARLPRYPRPFALRVGPDERIFSLLAAP